MQRGRGRQEKDISCGEQDASVDLILQIYQEILFFGIGWTLAKVMLVLARK